MLKAELRIWAMESYLAFVQGYWAEQTILAALKEYPNIDDAIKSIDSQATGMGWCGHYGSNGAWSMDGFRGGIDAWFPEERCKFGEPSVHITTRELFQYVKDGKPKHIQLELI